MSAEVAPGFSSAREGECKPLEGQARGMPRARRVFHAILVHKLEMDGALSIEEMHTRLYWFGLRLKELEIEQLVASAERHGVIVPLAKAGAKPEHERKAIRWIATADGRALPYPRGASLEDLGSLIPAALEQLRTGVLAWLTAIATLLAAVGLASSGAAEKRIVAVFLVFAFVLLLGLAGIKAERDLAAAANAWPRFKKQRPRRWEWQTLPGRSEVSTFANLLAIGLALVSLALVPTWVPALLFAAAGAIVAGASRLIYVTRLRRLAEEWRNEAKFSSRGTQRKRRWNSFRRSLKETGSWVLRSPKSTEL